MAGESAAVKAVQVGRGRLWQRALAGVGYITPGYAQAQRDASRWAAGAKGEQMTAALLAPLGREGWWGLYDRAIPGMGRANVDHLLIAPSVLVVAVDSKLWHRRATVHAARGGLWHGDVDKTKQLATARDEAETIGRLLGEPVAAVIAIHNAPVAGGGFQARNVAVLPANRLVAELRQIAGRRDPRAKQLAAKANRLLPPYVE